jgi:uncharacterized protein YcaQ
VLPFLLGDDLVARVDLKADRSRGVPTLHVKGAFGEEGIDSAVVASALAVELADLALWLGLEDVLIEDNGDLACALRSALH